MSIQAASLYSIVSADTAQAEKNLNSVSAAFNHAGAQAASAEKMFSGLTAGSVALGSLLGNLAASGLSAAVNGLAGLTNQLVRTGLAAYDATASYERLQLSLEALAAREIKNASGTERTLVLGQQKIELTEKERAKLEDLNFAYKNYALDIQQAEQRLTQLTSAKKVNTLAVSEAQQNLEKLRRKYAETGQEIAALEKNEGQFVTLTKKVVEGQLSMNEALAQASPRAQELLGWIKQLAIHSPFDKQGISEAFQTAMVYGFTSKEAQKLTQTMVDWAAASGKTSQSIGLVSYALGQMRAATKVNMQDLRQLMNAGIDVGGILKQLGYSLADVGEKTISAEAFIQQFTKTMDSDFGGAADRMTNSFDGLRSTLAEVGPDLLRAFATPVLEKFREPLAKIVELLTDDKIQVGLTKLGELVAKALTPLADALGKVSVKAREFLLWLEQGDSPAQAFNKVLLGMIPQNLWGDFEKLKSGFGKIFEGLTGGDPQKLFAGFKELGGLFEKYVQPELVKLWDSLVSWIQEKTLALPAEVKKLGEAFNKFIDSTTMIREAGVEFGQFFAWLTLEALPSLFRAGGEGNTQANSAGAKIAAQFLEGMRQGFYQSDPFADFTKVWEENLRNLPIVLNILGAQLVEWLNRTGLELLIGFVAFEMRLWEWINGLFEPWRQNWDLLLQIVGLVWKQIEDNVKLTLNNITNTIRSKLTESVAAVLSFKDQFFNAGKALLDAMAAAVDAGLQRIRDMVSGAMAGVVNGIYDTLANTLPNQFPKRGAGGNVEERDSGGPGAAGVPYLIGRGAQPELFIPKTAGTFIPNADKLLGGTTNNFYFNASYANGQSESSLRDDVALVQMLVGA